ncbi:muts domain V-domain-containing protein [Zychaea mexicana]|uniref:muts domain V-domain-containing protein n=1 Tax=Zychaea mexicana TaxID=64656 RepID=UPI0022FE429B|nr:muts domain V-domain-containing protein [Zychaea mexicana]KAI9499413.1 muts domain V-domain-containing protein [Zychaea mexicana]
MTSCLALPKTRPFAGTRARFPYLQQRWISAMLRVALRRPTLIRAAALSKRSISNTPFLSKRVTRGSLDDVFKEVEPAPATVTEKQTAPRKKQQQKRKQVEANDGNLEPKPDSTGSIVLDTVRKYTKKHPDCVLLVQVGDFYELYESHATQYATRLDLKLTRKEMTSGVIVDFAGFPSRSLDRYLDMLVNQLGCRVALCEQYAPVKRESDASVVGIQRQVSRVITPGTVIEERFLDSHAYNYLLAILPTAHDSGESGLAWIDVSIGEFMVQSSKVNVLKDDIARIRPREIILPKTLKSVIEDQDLNHPVVRIVSSNPGISVTFVPEDRFDSNAGQRVIETMFGSVADDAFSSPELAASNALLNYIGDTHPHGKPRLLKPIRMSIDETLQIDSATVASLELVKSLRDGGKTNSLLSCLNHTVTNAGSRQLTQWLLAPSSSISTIQRRHDIVEFFVSDNFILDDVRTVLRDSADAQRALQRLALRRGQYSDLIEIGSTLNAIKITKDILRSVRSETASSSLSSPTAAIVDLAMSLDPHESLADYIASVIDPERILSDETKDASYGFINADFDPQLRNLHQTLNALHRKKDAFQESLRAICGNSASLLVNTLYKHVVEINASQASKLLSHYPQASLVNQTKIKHRFQLSEWTDLSILIQNTHAQIVELENQIWDKAVDHVLTHSASIIATSAIIAQLDVFCSFAWMARRLKYVRPTMYADHNTDMRIIGGRHPVVESNLAQKGRSFIKNDCILAGDKHRSWLLTGPNMGGKSTFLRQNAIIVILAHMGSFVPALSAEIGVADRVMSRIGTADDLAQDLSTFMVEMMETANILTYATPRSLVIMDEVGRGTATTDGVSLAYAILAYLHTHSKSRLLFATHYHELSDMVKRRQDLSTIQLYKTDLSEDSTGRFVFLHKIQPGVCHQSHGLKVAQLAGLPPEVISTATNVWKSLNSSAV